jgi:hypothetical protein
MGDIFSMDKRPKTVFSFIETFRTSNIGSDSAQFELSKDESEIRIRYLNKGMLDEYLMTETIPGEGFAKIDQ